MPGITLELASNARIYETFELFINAVDTGHGGMRLECQYNRDLFDAATVRRWLAAYEVLLRAAVADPNQPVGRLPIVPDDDRRQLAAWNRTEVDYPRTTRVEELIFATARRDPGPHRGDLQRQRRSATASSSSAPRRSRRSSRATGYGPAIASACSSNAISIWCRRWSARSRRARPTSRSIRRSRASACASWSRTRRSLRSSRPRHRAQLGASHRARADRRASTTRPRTTTARTPRIAGARRTAPRT